VTGATVLAYHDLVEHAADIAAVSAAHRPYVLERGRFAAHLEALAASGRRPGRLVDALADPEQGRFVLTFDDGNASDHRIALPMLAARGWTACFFVIAGQIGAPGALGWSELRELAAAGMEIGSHSLTHPFLHRLSPAEIRHEFTESKRILEDGLGRAIDLASLPRGSAAPGTGELIASLGYRAFCTSEPGLVTRSTDPFAIPRIAVKQRTRAGFISKVATGRPWTLARLRSSYAVKSMGKQMVGAERWRRVRGLVLSAAGRARS
jgi:peptidoglycan/xylan/chitin deacetylase (PgdA/CDA1 family)